MTSADPVAGALPVPRPLTIVLSSLSSDAHTWNLVFLQLLLEGMGHRVVNLGACVPDDVLLDECRRHRPDAVVISTVNGHGHIDGLRLIDRLRAEESLAGIPIIIGGKLTTEGDGARVAGELLAAGFDAVFADDTAGFRGYIEELAGRRPALERP
ncbi:cobalamin-dependent protein [Actinoallomurus sp. NPDC050550]|uniref:cobalamin B12-binding domain-containing protein n=1 Tax=Actinoallomurus sp. NPDC050550 TaxID=3154937 RepID=UPI0033D54B39